MERLALVGCSLEVMYYAPFEQHLLLLAMLPWLEQINVGDGMYISSYKGPNVRSNLLLATAAEP